MLPNLLLSRIRKIYLPIIRPGNHKYINIEMKRVLIILNILVCVSLISCKMSTVSKRRGDKDLGGGYYLFVNGPFTMIVYNDSPHYKSTGLPVIPYTVIESASNKRYIFAITLDDENVNKSYWAIDKSIPINLNDCSDQVSCDSLLRSNVVGPIDSITFYHQFRDMNVKLVDNHNTK